jgi:hypothetical protein
MKPDDFRRIALSMTDAIESAHMGHPDFRANGRIFATLSPDADEETVGEAMTLAWQNTVRQKSVKKNAAKRSKKAKSTLRIDGA